MICDTLLMLMLLCRPLLQAVENAERIDFESETKLKREFFCVLCSGKPWSGMSFMIKLRPGAACNALATFL